MTRHAYFEQFEDRALRHPNRIALKTKNQQFSYVQLNRWSNAIARELIDAQVSVNIGILIGSEAAYVAAMLACGKAGRCFVPLDIKLPHERLLYLLDKAEINTVLCLEVTQPLLQDVKGIHAYCVDSYCFDDRIVKERFIDRHFIDNQGTVFENPSYDPNPAIIVKGSAPCYVMFTSGSTGLPKAVVGQHKGLTHFINWERDTFSVGEEDVCSWLAPVTFDVSLRDILLPLTSGGTLAIPDEETRRQMHRLLIWLEHESVTHMHCVPSVFRLLTETLSQQIPNELKKTGFLAQFKRILLAGEPTYYQDVDAWRKAGGAHIQLINLYGPTETTLAKVCYVVGHDETGEGMLPIGLPLPQTHVLIINGGQLCAPGDIGEIYIRTPYRSLGYLGDETATQAVFVQNPLHDENVDILYQTGDLGRYLDDGRIMCLGRLDTQVKINGVRIELGEVEAACRNIEGLHQVAVVAIEKDRMKSLCCYYNCSGNDNSKADGPELITAHDIRQALAAHLGEALIPAYYVFLQQFPTLINGKINRKALPEPEDLLYANERFVAPSNPTEIALCEIWSGILGLKKVCVDTEFFNLGGDSFKMMRVLSAIYKAFGREISIKQWLADSRITTIAKQLGLGKRRDFVKIPLAPQQAFYPVTAAQERLWTLHKMYPGISVYNLPEAYVIEGPVNIDALQKACTHLVERHESLRTVFLEKDGVVYQRILPTSDFKVNHYQYDEIDDQMLQTLITQNEHFSFDLQQGPLLKIELYRCLKTERHIFLFNTHHMISDGWSLANFVKELATFYQCYCHDHYPDDQPLRLQFKDYVVWQHQEMQSETGQASKQWWLQHLSTPLPVLELPRDYPRPVMRTFHGKTERILLPMPLFEDLNQLAKQQSVSLYSVLMFAIRTLLFRYTGQRDVIIGSPVAGRFHPELNEQMGYYVNTLALRQTLDTHATVAEAIQQTARCVNEALGHQHYPFEALIEALDMTGDISRSSVFDVMLVLQNFELAAPQLGDAVIKPVEKASQWDISRCDLLFHFQEDDQGLLLDINYNSDIFSQARIQRYAAHFSALIADMTSHHQSVERLNMLSGTELKQLQRWGKGESVERPSHSIPTLLTEIGRRHASAVALCDESDEMTYQQLEETVHLLATGLLASGCESGDVIALAYHRKLSSITAMLAIITAGCTYMPLDMALPEERLRYQLTHSRCKAVISVETDQTATLMGVLDSSPRIELACFSLEQLNSLGLSDGVTLPYVLADHAAYIIYTSGSTGTPKGVLLAHHGLINMSLAQIEAFNVTKDSRVLQFASLSFDASLANIFMALFSGARLVCVDQPTIEQPLRFLRFLREQQISVATLPPVYLKALNQPELPGLQTLITAGEAADAQDALHYAQSLNFFNAYGPTEVSVCATIEAVSAQSINEESIVSIGQPIANTELFIVVDDRCIAPIGVPGEIWIAGDGLAKAYVGDEIGTQQAFVTVPEPLQAYTQRQIMYKTGDLAYWDHRGRLIYVGRNDHQVKVNAFRVDTSEIEGHLRAHQEIAAAHVASYQINDTNKLAAWVMPQRQPELWPSVAEFYVYDDVLYGAMANDEARNFVYQAAFKKYLPDQVVVEIGPGSEAILSRLAIQAGAKKVYAIELLEETHRKATEKVKSLGLEEVIEVIHADIQHVVLPEAADWCISEIVGGIGGSEGAAKLINSCRHLLNDPSHMLPKRTLTSLAAVSLDHEALYRGFSSIAAHYVQQIFTAHGTPFDLRLCIKNLPKQAVISDEGVLEDLDYTQPMALESRHSTRLMINKAAPLSGLVCWLQLYADEENYLNSLFADKSWLPVYIPLFDGQTESVMPGDVLELQIERRLCENQLNPDFLITGELIRESGPKRAIQCHSLHQSHEFRGSDFYRQVFPESRTHEIPVKSAITVEKLREYLVDRVPNYAVPHFINFIEEFPLTVNGKVDREKLPTPINTAPVQVAASTEMEQEIAQVWQQVLSLSDVGVEDNFFALGGDSISAIRVVANLSDAHIAVDTRDIFLNPTIAQLALVAEKRLEVIDQGRVSGQFPLSPIQRWAFSTFAEKSFWFNQSCMLQSIARFDHENLAQALRHLLAHHDMLRAQIHQEQQVHQTSADYWICLADEIELDLQFVNRTDVSTVDEMAPAEFDQWHAQFAPDKPLFKAIVIKLKQHDILVLLANHLIVDTVSWRIIIEDLRTLLLDPQGQLPLKTESFVRWNSHLAHLTETLPTQLNQDHWTNLSKGCLSKDNHVAKADPQSNRYAQSHPSRHTAGNRHHQTFCIASDLIDRLTQLLRPTDYELESVYIAALGHSLRALTGQDKYLFTMESHGRNSLPSDKAKVNISRTVGWFTCFYPSALVVQSSEAETLQRIESEKEQLAEPGLSYMLSRWMTDAGESYQFTPQISFNYLGDFSENQASHPVTSGTDVLSLDFNVPGMAHHPDMECEHRIDWLMLREAQGLSITVSYHQDEYTDTQIEQLMDNFKASLSQLEQFLLRYTEKRSETECFASVDITNDELDSMFDEH